MAKTNIFSAAKTTPAQPETKSKKATMPVVVISKKENKKAGDILTEFRQKKEEAAKVAAEMAVLDASVREIAHDKWLEMYKAQGTRPTSFKLTAEGSEAVITYTSADAYQSVKADKAAILRELYGDDVVTEKDVYKINSDMLQKYSQVINDLIVGSKKIAEEDKLKLIECVTTYSVKEGIVDDILTLSKESKRPVDLVLADFGPTFQVK